MTRLETLAKAIEKHEGFYLMSRSWRNNNPGNLRASKFQTGQRAGFAYFDNYATGWLALWWDLHQKCNGNTVTGLTPRSTLRDLIYKWAPPSDGNETEKYLQFVAAFCGTSTTVPLMWFRQDL